MEKFKKGDQVVLGGKHFGDDTKYCTVMDVRTVGGKEQYLVAKFCAQYFSWVPAEDVMDPGEAVLSNDGDFVAHVEAQRAWKQDSEELLKYEEIFKEDYETFLKSIKNDK